MSKVPVFSSKRPSCDVLKNEIQSLPSSRRTIFEGEKDTSGRVQMVAVETSGGHLTSNP